MTGVAFGSAITDGTALTVGDGCPSCVGELITDVFNGDTEVGKGDVATCSDVEKQPLKINARTANNQAHNNHFMYCIFLAVQRAAQRSGVSRVATSTTDNGNELCSTRRRGQRRLHAVLAACQTAKMLLATSPAHSFPESQVHHAILEQRCDTQQYCAGLSR